MADKNSVDIRTKPGHFIIKSIAFVDGTLHAPANTKPPKIERKSDSHWVLTLECNRKLSSDRAKAFNEACGGFYHEYTGKGWNIDDEPEKLNFCFAVRIVFGYTDGGVKKDAVAAVVYFGQGDVPASFGRHNWWIGGYDTIAAGDQGPVILATSAETTIVAGIEAGHSDFEFSWKSKTRDVAPRAWMAKLADTTSLYDMSIPGTHDTCALHGGPIAETQKRSLRQQLDGGVRFIDIRVKHQGDKLNIYHGITDQRLEYGDGVQKVCLDFLKANPSETIVMSVKREDDDKDSIEPIFRKYMKDAKCEAQWWLADTMPTLSELRGKIVLFRRFKAATGNGMLGLKPQPWPDNTIFDVDNASRFHVQDAWKVPTTMDRGVKWNKVRDTLNLAAKGERKLFVNFGSGSGGPLCWPSTVANAVNPHLVNYLTAQVKGRFGAVLTDFETTDLNRLIFETNF